MTAKSIVPLVAVAALAAGALGSHFVHARDAETLVALETRVDALGARRDPPKGDAERDPALAAALESIERRVAQLERQRESARRDVVPERPTAGTAVRAERASAPAGAPVPDPERDAQRAELEALIGRLFGPGVPYGSDPETLERFFALARGSGLVEERIGALEDAVAADPGDVDARMALADAYVAKLMTVPGGPEQGVWGAKAEREWKAVVELEPQSWGAHVSLATNYSYYPDVMGKTGDAIAHYEHARELQRSLAPAPEHAQTYLALSRLYQRTGASESALEVLAEAVALHPHDAQLAAALAQAK